MFTIFQIISKFDLGGAERVAINISKSKNKKICYHIFEVVRGSSSFSQSILNELIECNVKFHRSYFSNPKIAIVFFPFWFLFSVFKQNPAVIHTHTEIPDLSIYLHHKIFGCFFKKPKYRRTIHNNVLWQKWPNVGKVVNNFYNKEKANIAISRSTKNSYESVNPTVSLPVIFNGVQTTKKKIFEFLKKDKINVLFAGRLEYQKGVYELCEVIKALKDNNTFYFHIVGEGNLESYIEKELFEVANATLYSKIYNLSSYLASFDYMFIPSNFEGLSLISIEASLSKTPSIVNEIIGLDETLPLDWILKVENNSIEAYTSLFVNELATTDRQLLGQREIDFVRKKFQLEVMQKTYEANYIER